MALIRLKKEIDRILSKTYHLDDTVNQLIQATEIQRVIDDFEDCMVKP